MSTKKNVEAIYPLSPQQKGMLLECLSTDMPDLHLERLTWVLHGELDLAAFARAWERVIAHHSIFRTAFAWKGQEEPLQAVLERVRLPLTVEDLRDRMPDGQEAAFRAYLQSDLEQGFDMSRAPLMRLALFRTGEREHRLVWTHHHILMDGWCRPVVIAEFSALYRAFRRGEKLDLPPTRPYRDYIVWLRSKEAEKPQAERFWRETLRGLTGPTPFGEPAGPPPAGVVPQHRAHTIRVPDDTASRLRDLARQHRLTLNTVVQGAWALLLSRYSGQSDVVFGTTVSGRPAELPGVETMIGLFINTLPLRVAVPVGDRVWSWLAELQARHLEARTYETCSAGEIHQWSGLPGSVPLYESLLVFENYPAQSRHVQDAAGADASSSGMQLASTDGTISAITRHPLTLIGEEAGSDLRVVLLYDDLRLDGGDVARIGAHLQTVLSGFVTGPEPSLADLLERIPAAERPRVRVVGAAAEERPYVAPRTPTETTLAQIWAEVLGLPRVGVHDSFLELGGHSLLGIRILGRINDAFGLKLPLLRLYEAPTLGDLATTVAQALAEKADAELLARLLEEVEQGETLR
jgi:acyl carrier protein